MACRPFEVGLQLPSIDLGAEDPVPVIERGKVSHLSKKSCNVDGLPIPVEDILDEGIPDEGLESEVGNLHFQGCLEGDIVEEGIPGFRNSCKEEVVPWSREK